MAPPKGRGLSFRNFRNIYIYIYIYIFLIYILLKIVKNVFFLSASNRELIIIKLGIVKFMNNKDLLNKKSELTNKYRHLNKFLIANLKLVSAIFSQIFSFHQMIALQNL